MLAAPAGDWSLAATIVHRDTPAERVDAAAADLATDFGLAVRHASGWGERPADI